MDFVEDTTNENTKIDYSVVKPIIDRINESGMVCRNDVLSLESKLGTGSIPNNIKNIVTSSPSRHGMCELLREVKTLTIIDRRDYYLETMEGIYRLINMLNEIDISKLVRVLHDDLELVNTLYVGNELNRILTNPVTTVGELPVNRLITGSTGSKVYCKIQSPTIRYLSSVNNCVGHGVLNVVLATVENNMPTILSDSVVASYSGTVAEYIIETIDVLNKIDKIGLSAVADLLLTQIESQICLRDPGGPSVDEDARIFKLIYNDRYIRFLMH